MALFPENHTGLSKIYNSAINNAKDHPAILLFVHDDIHLIDFFWEEKLAAGLKQFNVLGVAGNKRRICKQPAWAFIDERFTWDARENLSGVVGHGPGFPCHVTSFGPTPAACRLLDGVFLAAESDVLAEKEVMFDERFDFHFYDMDFCRTAEVKGLALGTFPICIVHESGGSFGSPAWCLGYAEYLKKWGD